MNIYDYIVNGDIQGVNHNVRLQDIPKPMKKDPTNKTPIAMAAGMGNLDMVKFLFENTATLNAFDKNGDFAIHHAVKSKNVDVVSYILSKSKKEARRKNLKTGKTPAHYAASLGMLNMIVVLLPLMTTINTIDDNGETILDNASLGYSDETVQFLISKGANVNTVDSTGKTPLHKACSSGNFTTTTMLCSMGSDVNSVDKYGCTPLHYAAGANSIIIVKHLIERGAIIFTRDDSNRLPFDCTQNEDIKNILAITNKSLISDSKVCIKIEDETDSPAAKIEDEIESPVVNVPSSGELLNEPTQNKGWFSWLWSN